MQSDNGISGRDVALAAGAFAVGVLGSRLLAPLLAAGHGSVRARLGEDAFERLIQDHREILSTLREMEAVSADSTLKRGKLFLKLKRTLGKHALAEEDVVYPELHQRLHDVNDSKHLYDEHADIKIHLYELEIMLKTGEDWSQRVHALRELIEHHVRDEEDVQFPKLRAALAQQQSQTLSAQIHREEALIL